MRRREFLNLVVGVAAWPLAAHAQQPKKMRRIGVLTGIAGNDEETKIRLGAFSQELQRLGWTEGRNVRMDIRGAAGNIATARKHAAELVALGPDVILGIGNITMPALLEATRTIPIVFAVVIDPVGAGYIKSLSQPGGNVTGFMMFEYSLSGKWPELLKQIAPRVTRAAVLREPAVASGIGQFAVIQAAAPSVGLEVIAIDASDGREIEREVEFFARSPNRGLIVTAGPAIIGHRKLIVTLAARHNLPAVYIERLFVKEGGLLSYGPDLVDATRRMASYVDRIFKGEKPAELPVQVPHKYDLVINLKTAKALGLDVSPAFLARADEVIE
jgi:putative tryptophan/tyrosine transport system substrate-binding protein